MSWLSRVLDRFLNPPARWYHRSCAPEPSSVVLDVGPLSEQLRAAVCSMFKLTPERVSVQTSATVDGVKPVIIFDVLVDGEQAPLEVLAFVNNIFEAARELNAKRKAQM